jgi:hypothetical protein
MKQHNGKKNGRVAAFKREAKTKKCGFKPNCNKPVPTSSPDAPETAPYPKRRKIRGPKDKIHDFVAKGIADGGRRASEGSGNEIS